MNKLDFWVNTNFIWSKNIYNKKEVMVYETITIKKLKEKNSFLPDELSLKKG